MNTKKIFFFIILFVACAGQIASDIYSPSVPAIALSLHASIAYVQSSMAIFMLGMAVSQLFYGPLSEGIGRRQPLLIGLSILFLGNLISLFSPTIGVLILGRFIQGCGVGACAALWRAIFRDSFDAAEMSKYGSYLSIFVTFIVPATPVLGGYLQEYFTWRASFLFLTSYSLITGLIVFFGFKETSQHHHLERLKVTFILKTFRQMLSSRLFMGYTLCTFLCYGAFFSWFSTGPVILINTLGVSPSEFGWITLICGGIATALGGWVNGRFVGRLRSHTMLRAAFVIMLIAGLALLASQFLFPMSVLTICLPMLLFYFGATLVWPNVFAGAFAPFGKIAGYAGALYGFMQISGAAVIGQMISYIPHQNQTSLALIFITTAVLAWLVIENVVEKQERLVKT